MSSQIPTNHKSCDAIYSFLSHVVVAWSRTLSPCVTDEGAYCLFYSMDHGYSRFQNNKNPLTAASRSSLDPFIFISPRPYVFSPASALLRNHPIRTNQW